MTKISKSEFNQLASYIKNNYGINLPEHKCFLLTTRLYQVLQEKGFKNFSEYYQHLIADNTGQAVTVLLNKITTNHTFFMREEDHFNFFKEITLPYWVAKQKKEKDLRIWSAGCSTGEEAYTLAMILADYFAGAKDEWDTSILATDISLKVLQLATQGIYPNEKLQSVPFSWRQNYFISYPGECSQLRKEIKRNIIFRRFNLMNEVFPFKKKFHAIFCRNVMIYFDEQVKRQLVEKFYEHTEVGGYLFIGHSEILDKARTKYRYVRPAVYRKES